VSAAGVELHDVQGNVLRGYTLPHAAYVFVDVHDAAGGRAWLAGLRAEITPGMPWPPGGGPDRTLNVACTFAGLRALGVPPRLLRTFPPEFRAGMAARAAALGDAGEDAPARWDPELSGPSPHLLLVAYDVDRPSLKRRCRAWRAELERPGSGLGVRHLVLGGLLHRGSGGMHREHFGFADGFSQPDVRDGHAGPREGEGTALRLGRWRAVAPGEFVLGYRDEDGEEPVAPAAPLGRNGSFVVVRKLEQHVGRFRAFVRDAAGGDPQRERWLAARVVGRWADGTPLALRPDAPDPALVADRARLNRFGYADDPGGLRCPVGAHVRRANPRDGLGWQGRLTKRHRIIRRGMSYGPALPHGAADDGVPRGLMFVCYQASIARQFEFIQRRWIGDGNALGAGAARDFLLGGPDPGGRFVIPGGPDGSPLVLAPQPRFVTLRGGDYFFAPSLTAIDAIVGGFGAR